MKIIKCIDKINNKNIKQIDDGMKIMKTKTKSITFSFIVGPNISLRERIDEYQNGNVGCSFAFQINKKYDVKKYGNSYVRIDLQNLRGRKPSC